jgi:hypothetical protein
MSVPGYKSIYQTSEILHRNVSINNMMYRARGIGTHISGVLIDYDLATIAKRYPAKRRGTQVTGTRPFMALDLLDENPKVHTFNHDLESLAYCYLWMIVRKRAYHLNLHDESNSPTVCIHPLKAWEDLSIHALRIHKSSLLFTITIPPVYEEFNVHGGLVRVLLHRVANANRSSAESDSSEIPAEFRSMMTLSATPVPSFLEYEQVLCGTTMKEMQEIITNAVYGGDV